MHPRVTRSLYLLLASLPPLLAQPVLTPSPGRGGGVSTDQGGDLGSYHVSSSVETGYRLTAVGGDRSLFRSVENYGDGLRVFGAHLIVNSKDGRGPLFDTLTVSTTGLGNDPYGFASVSIEKKQRYRYDSTWRRNDYYNPSLNNGESATLKNTRRSMQDHDLTISAKPWARVLLGYTRNHETGPEFTAYETYIGGLARSVLPLSRDTRREFNEYRAGSELDFAGFRLLLTHRWESYKDDSGIASLIPGQPYAADTFLQRPFNPTLEATYPLAATAYLRSQPMHSGRQGWLGNLSRNAKTWSMNARMTYSKGDSSTLYGETQSGASQAVGTSIPTGDGRFLTGSNSGFGPAATALTYMPGSARQPFLAGDALFSLFPVPKLTITSTTSVQSNRYDGTANEFRAISTGAAVINRFYTFHLGTGRVSSALDLHYILTKWLSLHSEYRYTSRFIDNNLIRTGTTNSRDLNSVRNHLNTGTFGFRVKPLAALSVNFDGTIGRDNGPLTPTSAAQFHNIRTRIDYRQKRMKYGVSYRQLYNLNAPLSVFSASTGQLQVGAPLDYYASHSRDLSATASYEANRHWALDASYTKAHWDSLANLWAELVPAGSTTINTVSVRGYTSQYVSNLHTVSLLARFTVGRGMFYAGYNLSRDTGDGRHAQNLGLTDLAAADTASWSSFPMTYQAPLARLSIKLSPQVQWNAGWQLYRYRQQFAYYGYQPYYRAHVGYSSLTYTFGSVPAPRVSRSRNQGEKP